MSGYEIAKIMRGLHENKDTKQLDQYISKYVPSWRGLHVNSTAWCAAIMNAWERAVGKPGNGKLNARSFLTYGEPVKNLKSAQKGDILVFARGGSTWMGHVCYYDGMQDNRTIRTVGGNQSDSVSTGYYPVSRLLGIRRS